MQQQQQSPTTPASSTTADRSTIPAQSTLAAPLNPHATRSNVSLALPPDDSQHAASNGHGGPADATLNVDSIPQRRGHFHNTSVGSFTSFLSSSPPSLAADNQHAESNIQTGDDSGATGAAPAIAPFAGDELSLPSPAHGGIAHYPGVVMSGPGLGFDDVKLDADSMADILDPAAATSGGLQGPKAAAGANIAPWLEEDEPPSPSSAPSQCNLRPPQHADTMPSVVSSASTSTTHVDKKEKKMSHLSHFPSVPNIPRILHRHHNHHSHSNRGSGDDSSSFLQPYPLGSATPSLQAASSTSSLFNDGTVTPTTYNSHKARSVIGGRESPLPPVPDRAGSVASTGGHHHRIRFGSTATTGMTSTAGASTHGDSHSKKKGFLGNFLRRKTGSGGASSPQLPPDFMPPSRVVTTGSISTQGSSLRNPSVSTQGTVSPTATWSARSNSIQSDSNVSPLHAPQEEDDEPELFLNTNLDDMEGIVDPNLANQARLAQPLPTSNVGGEMGLADALHHTSSFAYGNGTVGPSNGRAIVEQAGGPSAFTRPNPFMSYSSGSASGPDSGPPSPFTVSPKTSIPNNNNNNAPRRPSQLRNVKLNSCDSEISEMSGLQQPLAPSWAQGMQPPPNMFKDPFGSSTANKTQRGADGVPVSPSRSTIAPASQEGPGSSQSHGYAPAIPPSNAASSAAAWAAPESWGVEADGIGPEEEDTTSSSDSDSEWVESTENVATPGIEGPDPIAVVDSAAASGANTPRAGRGSHQGGHHRYRPKIGGLHHDKSRWVSDAAASVPHFIRIYRADGSYTVMSFPIGTTTSELISSLSGEEAPTKMKLYIRERGQDRQLLSSERPLALQARRLLQAGYTEAERIEEIGKEDLGMLCRFIYQTPVLPVMNPEEESSYDSFQFIDLSGRDLQVIPIFLHLHADDIIILNVSRNPMTDLPLDFIQACTSLKELRMSNMALKRIPANIPASTTLSRLDLSCNRIVDLESAHLCDIQTLLSLKVQNNRLYSIPSYFMQMNGLKYLNISNNVFEEFPTVVCQMSNLVDLDVSFNRITQLPSQMSNLRSLERLICVGNELTEFPESFSTLANLRVLDVRRNKLVDLTPVYALPQLEVLRADSNDLVTLDTQLGAKVRNFSVPYNSITRFTLASITGMSPAYSLTSLNLSHGKLSSLAESALSELVNLAELNLSFNQFTRLPQTLDRLVNLEILSCTDNMLETFPAGCFAEMQRLRICNIHNNNLKELPEDVWVCSSIESINLSSNLLESWPSPQKWYEQVSQDPQRKMSTISALSNRSKSIVPPAGESLTHLFLCDNRLRDDIFDQIALFGNLKVLNVSFNQIFEVPPYTLSHCERLEALYLSGNKLTSLPAEDLERLVHLKVLHLNGNKLQTLPSELGSIKHLEHLDVGSNVLKYNIANWPYDWNWNWNTALRYLNLSGNKRLEIKPTSGQEMHQHTNGPRRELSNFSSLTHLKVLGLMDVTLRIPLLPDESDEKRVRTSFSNINNMAYGISDMLGTVDHLAMFDLAVPNFRGSAEECVFGMFGRAAPSVPAGKIPKYVQEHFSIMLAEQLRALQPDEAITEALRRTFLHINKATFDALSGNEKRHRDSNGSLLTLGTIRKGANFQHSQLKTGASAAVVYLRDKHLFVANAGDTLVIISRKGEAELLSKRHDPTDREETARIRRAEAWVSTKGFVNDDKEIEISRAFGFYQALPAVNASPETKSRQLTEADEFIIIGNSALWKCCSYQTAVDIARTERDDPMMAAQKLRDFAISYGAEGSVMVMVVNVSDLFFWGSTGRARVAVDKGVDGTDFALKQRAPRRRLEDVGDRTLNRLQQEVEPPTGQIAIVFTDIVNSTALWETNPGMPTAIKMHHSLMRRQLRLDGGYEVKTEGDSFMVSFQSVTAALLWAFNCQIGLLQLEWPRELLSSEDGKVIYDSQGNIIHRGLRVRMGVHWGAPECERDPITRRMDYYGPMVNRAARINASADGGQLMASQDVINEIRHLREYIESSDEHSLDELDPVVKREVLELRRIGGLDIKDMGERKLKGLEVPEKLSLLYPKALSGRLELFTGLRANVEVNNDSRIFASDHEIEDARQLANITLRLEALCALQSSGEHSTATSPTTPYSDPRMSMLSAHGSAATIVPPGPPGARMSMSGPTAAQQLKLSPNPNPHLGPAIRDSMTEDELLEIIGSLTTRLENCLSTLYLKHLGGFATVLAALEQATHIDQGMLVHALSLMSGAMAQPSPGP